MNKPLSKLAILFSVMLLASCKAGPVDGKGQVDNTTTAGNSALNPQFASMTGCLTDLTLHIEDGKYTFTKELYSKFDMTAGKETDKKTIDAKYTFTGSVESQDKNTYTLAPATGVKFDRDWGFLVGLYEGSTPNDNGTGDEKSEPEALNWFYTPYLKDNKANTQSMKVTIEDGKLSFGEDFPLTESEE